MISLPAEMLTATHPLLTAVLPEQEGYPVGHAFVRCSPVSTFRHACPILKGRGRPAFDMTSVDYSIYYPCAPPPELRMAEKQGVGWVPPHHEAVIRGYKHFPYLGWLSYGGSSRFFPIEDPGLTHGS